MWAPLPAQPPLPEEQIDRDSGLGPGNGAENIGTVPIDVLTSVHPPLTTQK